ncbi:replication-relaxation family protein [Amycolatopsis samaneae]|uniref:Replication-relaxation family protein n=1 Tax=Amycolatopsis samaneae TaxID=664691 RepID=A0ABW5GTU4_9PSEU
MSGRERARRLAPDLSDRDLAILQALRDMRLMTGAQLGRLHVSAATPTTQARKTRAVLQRLTRLGLLIRLERRIGGIRSGSDGMIYGLSGLGHAVLDLGQETARRHRRRLEGKPPFQDHVLAVAETYVQLVERTRTGRAELLEFAAEPRCWRRFNGMAGDLVILKPDGFVRVEVGDYEISAFLEVDRDTENMTRIARKLDAYRAYFNSGTEQERFGVFPKTWWLVPRPARAEALARQLARLPNEHQALFTVCLASDAADRLIEVPTEGGAR